MKKYILFILFHFVSFSVIAQNTSIVNPNSSAPMDYTPKDGEIHFFIVQFEKVDSFNKYKDIPIYLGGLAEVNKLRLEKTDGLHIYYKAEGISFVNIPEKIVYLIYHEPNKKIKDTIGVVNLLKVSDIDANTFITGAFDNIRKTFLFNKFTGINKTCFSTSTPKDRSFYLEYDACCNILTELTPKWKANGDVRSTGNPWTWGSKKLRAKYNYPITFQVVNINPYKYNVSIEKEEVDIIDTSIANTLYKGLFSIIKSGIATSYSASGKNDSTDILNVLKNAMSLIDEYESEMIKYGDCINSNELQITHKKFISTIDSTLDKILGIKGGYKSAFLKLNGAYANKHKTEITQLLYKFDKFYNMNFIFVYHVPQIKNRDELIFTLNVEPKDGIKQGIFIKDEEIRIPIRGGLKIDGSLGFFYSTLNNTSYTQKTDSLNVGSSVVVGNRIYQPTSGSFSGEFGALALVHFYWRWWSRFNFGASAGVGFTFAAKPQPRYFIGLSGLVGRHNRFCITSGVVLGNTEKFMPYVNYNSFVPKNDPITYSSLEMGGFVSLTYNLPIPSKQKVKSESPPKENKEDKKDKEEKNNITNSNTVNVGK